MVQSNLIFTIPYISYACSQALACIFLCLVVTPHLSLPKSYCLPNSELNPISSKLPVTLATCWKVIKISHPICSQRHIYFPVLWLVLHALYLAVQRAGILASLFPVSLTLISSIGPRRYSGTSHTEGQGQWSIAFPLVRRSELSYLSML